MKKEIKKEIFPSSISAVTVFRNEALVRRTATAKLEKGSWDVVITPIPSKAKPESFRVKLETIKGKATLTGLNYTQEYKSYGDLGNKEILEREIEYLESQIYDLQAKLQLCDEKRNFLKSIKTRSINDVQIQMTSERPTPEDWKESFDFIFATEEAILKEEKDFREKMKEFQDKLSEKRKELEKLNTPSLETFYFAHVFLEVENAGTFSVSVEYLVEDVSWFPDYELRVDKEKGNCFLTYCGIIFQNTGEDWQDANLTLSTALPSKELRAPEPDQWIIKSGNRKKTEEMSEPTTLERDLTDEGAPGIILPISQSVLIPATGEPVKAIIEHEKQLEGELLRKAFPQQSPNVFIYFNTKNPFDYPILPGKVAIFHGNTFNGMGRVESIIPGESFLLQAGIDDEMDVTWKLGEKSVKKKEKMLRYNLVYRGTLTNRSESDADTMITLYPPISKDELVKIGNVKFKPEGFELQESGMATEKVKIEKGETFDFSLSFYLECPPDTAIYGITLF